MSTARSLILLGLPGLAIVLGILWYRKRNPHISDPGGSKKKLDKIESISEKLNSDKSDKSKHLEIIFEENCCKAEKLELNKSLPIDIPVGSPVELTDDQLDIEILKMQSQKSQEKETSFNRLQVKTLSYKSLEKSDIALEKSEKLAVISADINQELNSEVEPEQLIEIEEIEHNILNNTDSQEDIIIKEKSLIEVAGAQEEMAEEKQDTCNNNTSVEITEKICISDKNTTDASVTKQICEEIERSDWSEELCELECQTENADAINTENIRDSAYHSPTENMSSSPQLSAYSDRHSEVIFK